MNSTKYVQEDLRRGNFFAGHLKNGMVHQSTALPTGELILQGGEIVAHTITEDCTNCAACEDSCPVNAISEQGSKRAIDADTCIDCGACVDTCPVSAIHA